MNTPKKSPGRVPSIPGTVKRQNGQFISQRSGTNPANQAKREPETTGGTGLKMKSPNDQEKK